VPGTVEQSVEQAVGAVKKGIADGQRKQLLELVLPLIGPRSSTAGRWVTQVVTMTARHTHDSCQVLSSSDL